MDPEKRLIIEWPIRELWNDAGPVPSRMLRDELSEADVKGLLGAAPVQFIFAPFGRRLEWVPLEERFDFWKSEVQQRLTQWGPENRVYNDDFPDGFVIASQWEIDGSDVPVVLLSLHD